MKAGFYEGKVYDTRHGGPFDRGAADSYYGRGYNPHCYIGNTYTSTKVERDEMTAEDVLAYMAGYKWNEQYGEKKECR